MCCFNDHIALKFYKHLDSAAAEVPVKCQSDLKSLNLATEKLIKTHEIIKWMPWCLKTPVAPFTNITEP